MYKKYHTHFICCFWHIVQGENICDASAMNDDSFSLKWHPNVFVSGSADYHQDH